MLIRIEPSENDLPVADAESIARKAIATKDGLPDESLSAAPVQIDFLLYGSTNRREYRIMLTDYDVFVDSPTGNVTYCRWIVLEKDRTLPKGYLSHYPNAAEEFISTGAFDLQSPEE